MVKITSGAAFNFITFCFIIASYFYLFTDLQAKAINVENQCEKRVKLNEIKFIYWKKRKKLTDVVNPINSKP